MHYDLYVGQPLVSDDAGQFKILGFLHGLCWLHAERSLRKLVPRSPREQEAIAHVRDAVWKYYQRLRLPGNADAETQSRFGAGLRPAVPTADRLCGPE